LTKVNTDTVPAMLTPREAVLNRNAAELAGRPAIEALNKEGNQLAAKGVDLAAEGNSDMKSKQKPKGYAGGADAVGGLSAPQGTTNFNKYGVAYGWNPATPTPSGGGAPVGSGPFPDPGFQGAPDRSVGHPMPFGGGGPQGGMANPGIPGQKVNAYGVPYGWDPSVLKGMPSKSFYPGLAQGTTEVVGIGDPNPSKAYDDKAGMQFDKAPDISGLVKAIQEEGKRQGLSASQMAGIVQQFSGAGGYGGGAPAGGDLPYDQLGGQYASFTGGTPGGYQGGISEVGYPPGIAPNAVFSYDEGGWTGPLDPRYSSPGYARGSRDIPDWADPEALGEPNFGRPSTIAEGGRQGYINRSSWGGGAPGFPWSPTMIPTNYNAQGYPYAVPVQGPDQNLQGVGRTHNLRHNQ
jgi:hypothetical protein